MHLPQPFNPARRRVHRSRRPQVPAAGPPPSGASVIAVRFNFDRGEVEWQLDSLILGAAGDIAACFKIAGFETVDWDGWNESLLYTMHFREEGGEPGPGDLWTAIANDFVVTEQGGVVGGNGVME